MTITHSAELLASNLALWEKAQSPLPPKRKSPWDFCHTGKKQQLNLVNANLNFYLHSTQNIDVEVRQWVGLFNPHEIEWVIVFGVGLGYYYSALKNWLSGGARRRVLFVEDDLDVLYAFLETSVASELLSDPKASLFYVSDNEIASKGLEELIQNSLFRKIHISALGAYLSKKRQIYDQFTFIINFFRGIRESTTSEYLTLGKIFLKNFYANVLDLDSSVNGLALVDQFQGIPAIICGAGPSLEKNIGVLKELKERCLIFAGGTAMNALNAYGFVPHFGCGVDPFITHYQRILANCAFETPFFFRSRMNSEALACVNGPRLYLPGATGYPIAEWVDEQLGIPNLALDEGSNVINTSLSIAQKLGCNPILIVGLDLAYSNGFSYAPGITAHAISDSQFSTKSSSDELVQAVDIHGQPIYTLMKWFVESSWYADFARRFPEVKLLNCTEGGIGFAGVENLTLQEAKEKYLQKSYDIDGKIASAILSDEAHKEPSFESIKEVFHQLVDSLTRCGELLSAFKQKNPEIFSEKIPEETTELIELERSLSAEVAYEHLLKPFDKAYQNYIASPTSFSKSIEPSIVHELLKGRLPYLVDILLESLKFIQKALKNKSKKEKALLGHESSPKIPLLEEKKAAEGEISFCYYPSGEVLSEISYRNGVKHGPAKTFTKSRQLLSDREFWEGKETGTHLYFFSDGKLKSQIPYTLGKLDGQVLLYYSNGILKRSSTYKEGMREGFDFYYNVDGSLLLKAEYQKDKPVGKASMWHPGGQLSKEVAYFTPGVIASVKHWDANGRLIERQTNPPDYIDMAVLNTLKLQKSIAGMEKGVSELIRVFKMNLQDNVQKEIANEMKSISEQMEHLQSINKSLIRASGLYSDRKEAIWKTPSNQNQLYAFLQGITSPMQEVMLKLQWQLKGMIQDIEKKKSDDSKEGL